MLTDDENIINIQFAVQYILKSPESYLFNNRFPDETVGQAAETAMREIVGRSKMDFVLYEGREDIAASAQSLMQSILDRYDTGIQISRVTMQNAQPPEQVQAAFDDAVKAGQDRERQKNEGEAYANNVIPRARGTADRLLEEARAYRDRVVAAAEGEASRFEQILIEYNRAPVVTRERLYLETMQEVLSKSSKVMIDAKGNGNLLFLPLDKLMQQAGAPAAATGTPAPADNATAAPAPSSRFDATMDPRSRDFARLRERGER
jgi:membrane protease subunit HflK